MSLLKLVVIAFVAVSGFIANGAQAETSAEQNTSSNYINLTAAPSWTLSLDDKAVSSATLHGKPYVLHFWATWCPYCKRLQPGLEKVASSFSQQDVSTYAVSFWENPNANPAKEMQMRGLNLSVLAEGDNVAKSFNVQGTPTTVFVNHRGEILARLTTSNPNDPQIRMAYQVLEDEYKRSLTNTK